MKRFWAVTLISVLVLGAGGYALAQQFGRTFGPARSGMMGGGMGPGMMGTGMGPGMMGTGMGPGMMGGGMMGGRGPAATSSCPGWAGTAATTATPTKEQLTAWVNNHLTAMGNPNLKLGEVKETDTTIEAQILTKDNSLVEKIIVDKRTGRTTRAF